MKKNRLVRQTKAKARFVKQYNSLVAAGRERDSKVAKMNIEALERKGV